MLNDAVFEGDETIELQLLPGDGYTVGYPPGWDDPYLPVADTQTITLQQAAVSAKAEGTGDPDATFDAATQTFTVTKPADGHKFVDFNVLVTDAQGTGQENAIVKFRIIDQPGQMPGQLHGRSVTTGAGGGAGSTFQVGVGTTVKKWRVEMLDAKDNVIGTFYIDVKE